MGKTPWITGYSHDQLVESQRLDPCLGKLITWLSTGEEPVQKDLFLCSPTVKYFFNCRKQLVCQNGLLLYKWEEVSVDGLLLMVPEKLKNEVISYNHDLPLTGHMGIVKTIARVKQSLMWYGLTKDVELYVKSCSFCNKNKRASVKTKAALGQYHAGSHMERVHVDILGPFTPSSQGNQYVLMLVDQFTKWLECYPLPNQTAESVAKCVVDGFISRFGCPLEIHTDQGKNFDGKLFLSVCELLQIAKTRTMPYHPCSNGQVERYNRTLLQLIRCFLKGNQQDWDQYLQQLAGAIRSTVNRQTGFTPNLMMLGREVMLPVHLLIGEIETQGLAPAEYVKRLRSVLRNVHTLARDKLESSQCRQKRDYDLRLKTNTYEPRDIVYQLDSAKKVGQSSKLWQVWKGPLLVLEVLSPVLFKVANQRKAYVIHHDRLKPCDDRNIPLWLNRMRNQVLNNESRICEPPEADIEDMNLGWLFSDKPQCIQSRIIPKCSKEHTYAVVSDIRR